MPGWLRVILGFGISVVLGHFVLWALIDKALWPHMVRVHRIEGRKSGSLTWLLGMTERFLYTGAFILGYPQWVGVWLAIKVAVGWRTMQKRESPSDNLWLIGTALSLVFGFLGACFALCRCPLAMKP